MTLELGLTDAASTSTAVAKSDASNLSRRASSTTKQSSLADEDYPFGSPSYNPFVEWGCHYQEIFERDLWARQSNFVLQDLNGVVVSMFFRRTASYNVS